MASQLPTTETEEIASAAPPPLSGTRAQSVQRLQVGLSGLAAMVLLVALASVILDRARFTDANAVPEAAATVAPPEPPAQSDPLADAGVVPDLPTESEGAPAQQSAFVPETGNGAAELD